MTEIRKAAGVAAAGVPDDGQMEKINRLSRSTLTAQDVYVFAVRLCDDQPDRDFERFSEQALKELGPMFIGRTGIMDHEWSAGRQVARIFDTQLEYEGAAVYLKAWAYLLRTPENENLIREIDGGIKKEVSVGCAVKETLCSVCGAEYGTCQHRKGEVYGGQTCLAVHTRPADAYEFSFVAVPAQKEAGVLKKGCAEPSDAAQKALQADAELGRCFRAALEKKLVTLGLTLDAAPQALLERMASSLSAQDLQALGKTWEDKCAELFWDGPQLSTGKEAAPEQNGAFLI